MSKNDNKIKNKSMNKKSYIKRKHINFNILLIFAFCVGLICIYVTYAWFSASLNARIDFVNLTVSNETGLYISLDGQNYGSSITVSENDILYGINNIYPDHNNKWAPEGLFPTSSSGIPNSNTEYFRFFDNEMLTRNDSKDGRYLDAYEFDKTSSESRYIAFDVFLKNISNNPEPDSLYLFENTNLYLNGEYYSEMPGLFNSARIGISHIGYIADKNATANQVQNISCNNNCESFIYEPNSTSHSYRSIIENRMNGIELIDGEYYNTYSVIKGGEYLDHYNGHGDHPIDTEHFELQETFTELNTKLFDVPHGVTKIRVYIWLEGQDIDSIESFSRGAILTVNLSFIKDVNGEGL